MIDWQYLFFIFSGFSQLNAAEFFVFRKTESCETKNHLLLKAAPRPVASECLVCCVTSACNF